MASKKAYVFILDLGSTMGDCHNGRDITDLDWGMQWAWDKMATIMARGLKGDNIGVIGLRTDKTDNELAADDPAYENISVLKELGVLEMDGLRSLQEQIAPSNTENGDAISAIVLATQQITKFTMLKTGKPGKYDRYIYLLTDGQGGMDGDDLDPVVDRLNEIGIDLTVIGIDFDSDDPEFVEDDKSAAKKQNEDYLKQLTEKCTNGTYATALQAVEGIATPAIKETRPIASYTGILQLGDFEKDMETSVMIDIVRYPKTKIAKPVSASKFVPNAGPNGGDDLSSVKFMRNYQVKDLSTASGTIHVDRDDLAKGYLYGRTIVPMSEEDAAIAKLETTKSFSIIGFIPMDKYDKCFNMGESYVTIAPISNDKARMAMSSLVRALHETESYAVARLVLKDMKDPQIVLMAPLIEPGLEALVDVPLPFAEDVRIYQFPPLDRVITTSGVVLSQHRNLPTKDLIDAMSNYVDSMDLSALEEDDEGKPSEYMPFDETYNPTIHRINQAIRERAIYPDQELSDPAPMLRQFQNPPESLLADSESKLKKLVAVADVKLVEERKKGRGKRARDTGPAPISGIDLGDLLSDRKKQKISNKNAIPEFKQMIEKTNDNAVIGDAIRQLGEISRVIIASSSMGGNGYEIALRQIGEMRKTAVDLEVPEPYNEFVLDLKKRLVNLELGNERRDFWSLFKRHGFGLITSEEVEFSKITVAEAKEFYTIPTELVHRSRE